MIITILEAHVAKEKQEALLAAFKEAKNHVEPGLISSNLLHSIEASTLWTIETTWKDKTAWEEMRKRPDTPRGLLIFQAGGAKPELKVLELTDKIGW